MNIDESMVKTKEVAGKTTDGNPVIFIETHGGLNAFFCKDGKDIKTLGVGAHKAIAQFFSEKQERIMWNDEFMLKSEQGMENLAKSDSVGKKIIRLIFSTDSLIKSEVSDTFFLYHMPTGVPLVMKKSMIDKYIEKGHIDNSFLLRDVNLTTIPLTISEHPSFNGESDGRS